MSAVTSLARHIPDADLTPEQIKALARRAWLERGVALLVVKDITDPFARQAVRNEVEKQLGLSGNTR